MPFRRRSSTPGWYEPQLYASLEQCILEPHRCIAPIQKGGRCKKQLEHEQIPSAAEVARQLSELDDKAECIEIIRDFVLLHCCKRWHKDKLTAAYDGCLRDLAHEYYMPFMTLSSRDIPEDDPIENQSFHRVSVSSAVSTPNPTVVKNEQNLDDASGMRLRSGRRIARRSQSPKQESYFIGYKSTVSNTVRNKLLQDVEKALVSEGVVYSFTWPSHPGFVKIGYSKKPASTRMSQWLLCHDGAILSRDTFIPYPERMERLIHLEMVSYRRRIVKCSNRECMKSHTEWFELPIDDVNRVIDEWLQVATREPLYGPDKTLSPKWVERLLTHKGQITARTLLDMLDLEISHEKLSEVVDVQRMNADPIPCVETILATTMTPQPEVIRSTTVSDTASLVLSLLVEPHTEESPSEWYNPSDKTQVHVEFEHILPQSMAEPVVAPESFDPTLRSEDSSSTHTQLRDIAGTLESPLETHGSLTPSNIDLVHQVVATAVELLRQQDQILSYFGDFMTCISAHDNSQALPSSYSIHEPTPLDINHGASRQGEDLLTASAWENDDRHAI